MILHDINVVKDRVRRLVTMFALGQPAPVSYLAGLALEASIMELFKELGTEIEEAEAEEEVVS